MNKKGLKIGVIIGVLVVLGVVGTLVFLDYSNKEKEKKLLEDIKTSYSSFVYLDGAIYNETHEIVGEGKVTIALEKQDINNTSEYFKILDSSYYVKYSDVKKSNNNIELLDIKNYQSIGKVTTASNAVLYKNDENIKMSKSQEFDVIISYEDKYLVRYLGHDFYIDKKDVLNDIKRDENNIVVPVLKIENVSEKCLDTLCLTNERLEELLNILKNNGIYTMTNDEYQNYVNGGISFIDKVKAVVLEYKGEISDGTKNLLDKYGINIISEVSSSEHTKKYLVTDSFNETRVNDMIALKDIIINKNQKVPVLNYHFFYTQPGSCNETICISDKLFSEHLDYLINNNYYILTMSEYIDFLYGRISIPEKSILITVDDGAFGTSDVLPRVLEEKKVHATLFLISGWWELEKYQVSKYLEIYSHGHDLHHNDYCGRNGCGVKTLLLSKDELLQDLNTSINRIGSKKAFCYPFYSSNAQVRKTVREAGFQVAFGGGNRSSTMNSDKYLLPRFVIYYNTTVENLKKMLIN